MFSCLFASSVWFPFGLRSTHKMAMIVTVQLWLQGLSVWADSVTLITSEHLHAEDPDTNSNDIIFTVSTPSNGHLAFLNNTFLEISQFSQLDIDAGHVAFVHKGGWKS